jgi:hypothetical protein
MKSALLLNVIIRKGATILQLLSCENKALLVRRNSFLILNLRLHIVDGVRRLDLQSDGLSSECLNEDLHSSAETKDEMESRLLLDVVVRECATVFELLSGEDEALLVRGDALFVLDLGLHVVDSVRGFNLEGNCFASEGLNKNLHTPAKAKDEVESRFLLDVVIGKSTAVFELLSGEDQALLVGGNAFLVLDLGLDVVNCVRGLHLKGDRLARQGLDEDLHTTAKAKDEVKRRLLLDVVIRESSTIFKLLSSEDEALLVGRDTGNDDQRVAQSRGRDNLPLLVLDLGLNVIDSIGRLNLEGDCLASEGLYEDLHVESGKKGFDWKTGGSRAYICCSGV